MKTKKARKHTSKLLDEFFKSSKKENMKDKRTKEQLLIEISFLKKEISSLKETINMFENEGTNGCRTLTKRERELLDRFSKIEKQNDIYEKSLLFILNRAR